MRVQNDRARWSSEDISLFRWFYREGVSVEWIGRIFGRSPDSIEEMVTQLSIKRNYAPHTLNSTYRNLKVGDRFRYGDVVHTVTAIHRKSW